ncbi:MAG: hypothetical protein LBG64_04125, partial [Pseudomonadales bacterium]|nr:hypothetical protein [Pseudomonadales bacterium]
MQQSNRNNPYQTVPVGASPPSYHNPTTNNFNPNQTPISSQPTPPPMQAPVSDIPAPAPPPVPAPEPPPTPEPTPESAPPQPQSNQPISNNVDNILSQSETSAPPQTTQPEPISQHVEPTPMPNSTPEPTPMSTPEPIYDSAPIEQNPISAQENVAPIQQAQQEVPQPPPNPTPETNASNPPAISNQSITPKKPLNKRLIALVAAAILLLVVAAGILASTGFFDEILQTVGIGNSNNNADIDRLTLSGDNVNETGSRVVDLETNIQNYRFNMNANIRMDMGMGENMNFHTSANGIIDEVNRIQHGHMQTTVMGMNINSEFYADLNAGITYSLDTFLNTWVQESGTVGFISLLDIIDWFA